MQICAPVGPRKEENHSAAGICPGASRPWDKRRQLKKAEPVNGTLEKVPAGQRPVPVPLCYTDYPEGYTVENCQVKGCDFTWGSPASRYNSFAFVDGDKYLVDYDDVPAGVTVTGCTFTRGS